MPRNKKAIAPTKLTRKWLDQDVNHIMDLEEYGVRLPNDFIDWSTLSGEVTEWKMSAEELKIYNEKNNLSSRRVGERKKRHL